MLFASDDSGRCWPRYSVIFDGSAEGVENWEILVVQLADGRLLAVSWLSTGKLARRWCFRTAGCYSPYRPG